MLGRRHGARQGHHHLAAGVEMVGERARGLHRLPRIEVQEVPLHELADGTHLFAPST